jgi:hypothetical protein
MYSPTVYTDFKGVEEARVDLKRPYSKIIKEIEELGVEEKKLLVPALWDHFIPICDDIFEEINDKKSADYSEYNIYNALSRFNMIPWAIQTFGKSAGTIRWLLQDRTNRILFRFITDPSTLISPSMIQKLKVLHKDLLLLKHIYQLPDFKPKAPSGLYLRGSSQMKLYYDIYLREKQQIEEENPRFQKYLQSL